MTVSFYSISGRSNEINKLDNVTGFSVNVNLYNDFNPAAPTFYLDRLREANYCRFTYNGKIWVCSVSLVSFTDNIAVYSGSVDALATAWYNGCMNSLQLVQYSSDGNGSVMSDPRLITHSIIDRQSYQLPVYDWYNGFAAVTVLLPYASNYNRDIIRPQGVRTYLLPLIGDSLNAVPSAFDRFLTSFYGLTASDQQQFGQSILNISIIPAELVPTYQTSAEHNSILLYKISTSMFDPQTAMVKDISLGRRTAIWLDYSAERAGSSRHDYTVNTNIPINERYIDAQFELHASGVGVIKFTPALLGISGIITNIGYRLVIDYSSGTADAILLVNNILYPQIYARAMWGYQIPMFMDTSISNYWQMASTALLGVGSAVAAGITSGAALPVIGAAGALLSSAGSQIASDVMGGISVTGSYGGFIDLTAGRVSTLIINDKDPVDLAGFQALYGKPDGRRVKISTLSGYVQTLGARLPLNGLPYGIVQAAEGGLNAGAYII